MATRKESVYIKKHILAVGAKLMLANGYRNTTVREIADAAEVTLSNVQNFFGSKEGLLTELPRMMLDGQFGAARQAAKKQEEQSPIYSYAAETAVQLVLTDRNEQLRELYTEAYTVPEALEYISQHTTHELKGIFGDHFPDYEESDFYEMEIGSAALMRSYMAKASNVHFPLHRKIDRFLTAALRMYRVGEEELRQILGFVHGLELERLAEAVVGQLFATMEDYYEENVMHPISASERWY